MAAIELNHTGVANRFSAPEGRLTALVAALREYIARRALFNQTMRELNNLSARDLADLGINRSMIRSVAYEAAWGSK